MNKSDGINFFKNNREGWEISAKYHEVDLIELKVSEQEGRQYALPDDLFRLRWSKDIREIHEPTNSLLKRELTKGTDKYLTFSVFPNENGVLIIFGKSRRETEANKDDLTNFSTFCACLGGVLLYSSIPVSPGMIFGAGVSGLIYAKTSSTEDYEQDQADKRLITGALTSLCGVSNSDSKNIH